MPDRSPRAPIPPRVEVRLEQVQQLLDSLSRSCVAAGSDDAVRVRLANAAQLAELLESLTPELERATSAEGRTGAGIVSVGVVLEIYMRAVRELGAVALEARARIERTAAVVVEAREFARRRRRRTQKLAANRRNDAHSDA